MNSLLLEGGATHIDWSQFSSSHNGVLFFVVDILYKFFEAVFCSSINAVKENQSKEMDTFVPFVASVRFVFSVYRLFPGGSEVRHVMNLMYPYVY